LRFALLLKVSVGFNSKWKQAFEEQGSSGLKLKHRGSTGYLEPVVRQAVLEWLKQKNYWHQTIWARILSPV
jgi:putative transposase